MSTDPSGPSQGQGPPPGRHPQCAGTRRQFLWQAGAGFTGLALSALLDGDGFFGGPAAAATLPSALPHFATKAKACIFLFMFGGPSQVDLFDYKPELQKRDGQTVDNEFRRNTKTKAVLQASRRKFAQHGQSGLWCSDALPHLARQVDKMAFVKSLYSDSFAHGSALLQMNTGRIIQGHPSVGQLRPRHLEQEPALLRGDVGSPGRPHHGSPQLVERLHAGRLPGNRAAHARRSHP